VKDDESGESMELNDNIVHDTLPRCPSCGDHVIADFGFVYELYPWFQVSSD